MKIGIVYPQTEISPTPENLVEFAKGIESLGFDHIIAYEHVLGANPQRPGGWTGPYTNADPFWDPFTMFSFLAAITPSMSYATAVLILPQRQTALVAKQSACLDVLCNGKFRLGVGLGWNEPEYVGLGENFHNRGARLEEQIKILRDLWQKPLNIVDCKFHKIEDMGLNPLPIQKPIPVWMGGHVEKPIRRIARVGDGWFPGFKTVEDAVDALRWIQEEMDAAGRDPKSFGIEPRIPFGQGDGSLWKKTISGWQMVGADYFSLNSMGLGFSSIEEHLKAAEKFSKSIIQ